MKDERGGGLVGTLALAVRGSRARRLAWRAPAAGSSSALTVSKREARQLRAAVHHNLIERGGEHRARSKAKAKGQGRKETDMEMRWTAAPALLCFAC